MEDWKTYKLSEISVKITKGTTPTTGGDSFMKSGVNFIKAESVTLDGRIDETKFAFITKETHEKQKRSQLMEGDILFSMAGVILGKTAIVKSEHIPANTNQALALIRLNKDLATSKFVYYYLQQSRVFNFVNNSTSQSAQPNINLGQIGDLEIVLPPIEEQKAIAKILSSLDDKIELNRQMNATLEAMARHVFKAWFVDFEPVRANSENRPSQSASPEIAKLFPSEFENDIPKGWEEKELNQVFEINPTRSLQKGKSAKYLEMASVRTFGHRATTWINRDFSSGTKFKKGDTLLARITPCLENGKTAFVDFLENEEIGWGSTEFIVLRPKNGLPNYFAYLLCRNDDFRNFAIQSMTGTSGRQRVQVDSLGKYSLVVPPKDSLIGEKFGAVLNPIVEKIKQNSEEINYLAEIRDSLLPRLISGKIRVGEAENEIA